MTLSTAMEIVGNPRDLHFILAEMNRPGQYGSWYLAVNRGPGHNYKSLLSTDQPEQLLPSREDALHVIEVGVLLTALAAIQIPEGSPSLQKVNDAEGQEAKKQTFREAIQNSTPAPGGCLTLSMIDRIMAVLQDSDECTTWKIDVTPQDIADACVDDLSDDARQDIAALPLDEALGYAFTLLKEEGIENPEGIFKEKGILE